MNFYLTINGEVLQIHLHSLTKQKENHNQHLASQSWTENKLTNKYTGAATNN